MACGLPGHALLFLEVRSEVRGRGVCHWWPVVCLAMLFLAFRSQEWVGLYEAVTKGTLYGYYFDVVRNNTTLVFLERIPWLS